MDIYIYDDLGDYLLTREDSVTWRHFNKLLKLLRLLIAQNQNIRLLRRDKLINNLIAKNPYRTTPYSLTIAIGFQGSLIAGMIHNKTGWFPNVHELEMAREEIKENKYKIRSSTFYRSLKKLLSKKYQSLAIIDDTIYSGLSIKTILKYMSPDNLKKTNIFCLQGMKQTLPKLRIQATVIAGYEIPGVMEKDSTVIRASGLFLTSAIIRANKPGLAFYQRKKWMTSWFPDNTQAIIDISKKISELYYYLLNNLDNYTQQIESL